MSDILEILGKDCMNIITPKKILLPPNTELGN